MSFGHVSLVCLDPLLWDRGKAKHLEEESSSHRDLQRTKTGWKGKMGRG